MVQILLLSIRATRQGIWPLHLSSSIDTAPWFHAYDRVNYARYLPVYIAEMKSLPSTHPAVHSELNSASGEFVAQRQGKHGFSQVACDMAIKQTINRDSKTKGGMGNTQNKGSVNRWILSHPERAAIAKVCRDMAGKDDESRMRKDLDKTRAKRDNATVKQIMNTVTAMVDPFSYAGEKLINISSGLLVSNEVASNLTKAHTKGTEAYQAFCSKCILAGGDPSTFHQPIKALHLKTFASNSRSRVTTKYQKERVLLQSSSDLFIRLVIVSRSRSLDLRQLLSYSLTPIPASISTVDGLNVKTTKANLMHAMEDDVPGCRVNSVPPESALLFDGMALIQGTRDGSGTFLQYADRILVKAVRQCTSMRCTRMDFVTDRYPETSIKDCEHIRREASSAQRTEITRGDQKLPKQLTKFLSNGKNKENLVDFLLVAWSRPDAKIPPSLDIYLCHRESCTLLQNVNDTIVATEIPELQCDHQEADTRLMLHAKHACRTNATIVIASPDTDVFLLCASVMHEFTSELYFMTGTASDTRILQMSTISSWYRVDTCQAILGLHVFRGCDSTSAFKGKGKIKPLRLLLETPNAVQSFQRLGSDWDLDDELSVALEEFVCSLYGQQTTEVNVARYNIFTLKCRVDSALPPNKDCLQLHSQRASYQTAIYRRCLQPKSWHPALLVMVGNLKTKN